MVTTSRLTPPQALEPRVRTYFPQILSKIPQMGGINHIIEAGQLKTPKVATARLIPTSNIAEALPTPVDMIENPNRHILLAPWNIKDAPRNFPSVPGMARRNDTNRRVALSRRSLPGPIAGSRPRHVSRLTKTLAHNIIRPPGVRDFHHSTMIRFILARTNPDLTPIVE